MWPVTKDNADTVIVASASVMSYAFGLLTAYILTKNYMTTKYETIIETEVNQAKAYFSKRNKTGEYSDPVALAKQVKHEEYNDVIEKYSGQTIVEEEEVEEEPTPLRPRPKPTPRPKMVPEEAEDMESFEQRLIDKAKEEVQEVKDKLGVFEDEEDVDVDDVDSEYVTVNVFETQGGEGPNDISRESGRPYIISVHDFSNGDRDYRQNTLTYFEGDGVLVDERENPINHMNKIIGETNLNFGHLSEDKNVVYIRNDDMEVDFEVCRSFGKFTEEVLGFADGDRKPKVRKFRSYD